jgi:hypothetical protein
MSTVNLTGTVIDSNSGAALPGATIAVNGQVVSQADNNGNFEINADPSDSIKISYVGYSTETISASALNDDSGYVELSLATQTLAPVTITPQTANIGKNYTPILIGGAAILLLASSGKNKSVGKIKTSQVVIPLAIGAAVIFATEFLKKTPVAVPVTPAKPGASPVTTGTNALTSIINLFKGTTSDPSAPPAITQPQPTLPGINDQPTTTPIVIAPPLAPSSPTILLPGGSDDGSDLESAALMADAGIAGVFTPSPLGLMLAGIGCLCCTPKKTMSGAADYIVPGAIVIGGYFILKHFGLFGNTATNANNKSITNTGAAAATSSIASLLQQGQTPNYLPSDYAAWASAIYSAGTTGTDLNTGLSAPSQAQQDTIVNAVINADNLLDLLYLIQAFGSKEVNTQGAFSQCSWGFGNCTDVDLPGFITLALDASHKNTINGYLAATNINYQF